MMKRFEQKINKLDNGCWQWSACVTRGGYGQFRYNGRAEYAHRVSWLLYHGEIPRLDNSHHGYCVCHKCDNRLCVNPEHLFLGTNNDNVRDMFNKGRNPPRKGSKNGKSKLTEDKVREMRNLFKTMSYGEIASLYNISSSAVRHAIVGLNWKHIA